MAVMDAPRLPQHMTALGKANRVRLARAALKRAIADGTRTVADVVIDPPLEAETMTVGDLLMSQHRWGRTRTMRFLSRIPMSEAKRLGTMTPRQRKHFADTINGEHPEQPWGRADVGPARPPKMERTCALCGAGPGEPCLVTRRSHPWSPLSITTRPKQEPHGER